MDNIMTMEAPLPRSNRSGEIKDLACALSKAQGAMENAKKDSENPGFKRDGKNSTYADLASVWTAIRKPLADNGLCVMQWPRTVEGGVEIETELLHESGQFMRDTLWLPCPTMTVHTVGSTITYGRRYALMAIVGIAPEDDDGNAAMDGHKTGAPGSAGGGGQFRPARRSPGMAQTESLRVDPADKDMVQGDGRSQYEADKAKKAAHSNGATKEAEQANPRAAKLRVKTDEKIKFLKEGAPWTRDGLDQYWANETAWRTWMADANNNALNEWQRFLDAFADAEMTIRPVELA